MTWLLWKDYRHNLPIVLFWLLLLSTPYLVLCIVALDHLARGIPLQVPAPGGVWLPLAKASQVSLVLVQVAFALIGGNAFAGERVDRSAEFLASLPIARAKVVSSKLLFVAIIVAATWVVNSPFIVHLSSEFPARPGQPNELSIVLAGIAITGLVFFCVSWFLSSFLSSPTFAVGGGLVAPFLVIGTLSLLAYLFDTALTGAMVQFWYSAICLTIAPLCFVIGTCYYLRRVEP